jgi:16S rRNA G527 N7-methylase RsmG
MEAELERFQEQAVDVGLELSACQLERLRRAARWLSKVAAASGVSQYDTPGEALLRGMSPALAYFATYAPVVRGRLGDLGAGNGALGGTIAVCAPDLHADLVDRAERSYTTSELLVAKLDLANARALHQDIEGLDRVYDVAVFRALAPAPMALPLARGVVVPGGRICAFHQTDDDEFLRPAGDLIVEDSRRTMVAGLVMTCYRT